MLGQLGEDGHRGLPQCDVSEAQVSDLVLPLPVSVHDVDVAPAGVLPVWAAQVYQEFLLPALLWLRVRVLAAVAGAGRFITLL